MSDGRPHKHRQSSGSATIPTEGQTAADVLSVRKSAWANRPLTREVYRRYFERIGLELAPGRVHVELGGGSGMAKEFLANILTSDIVITPFVDFVADAMCMPMADGSVDNIFMVDVLHHLPHPGRLFDEITRVLRPRGRVVLLEPFISPFSRMVFKLAHPEPVDMSVEPLPVDDTHVFAGEGPFASNQAIPTLMFDRNEDRFSRRFPKLRLVRKALDSTLVYPLSGGFSGPCLVPRFAWPLAWGMEACLRPLRRWMAFRIIVTLERA
jgi:SAM-dependent methyltransferase